MLEWSTMNMFSVKYTACHMFTVYTYMYNYTAKVCTRHSHTVLLESDQCMPAQNATADSSFSHVCAV